MSVCFCRTESFLDSLKRQRQKLTLSSDKMLISSSHYFLWSATQLPSNTILLYVSLLQMKSTGIPELRSVEDIDYLRKVLLLNKNADEAAEDFKLQIQACLRLSFSTQLNFYLHLLAKKSSS